MLPFILEDREAIQERWSWRDNKWFLLEFNYFVGREDLTDCPLSIHYKSHLSLDLFAKTQKPP